MAESSFSKGFSVTCGVLLALTAIPIIVVVVGCGGGGALFHWASGVQEEVQAEIQKQQQQQKEQQSPLPPATKTER